MSKRHNTSTHLVLPRKTIKLCADMQTTCYTTHSTQMMHENRLIFCKGLVYGCLQSIDTQGYYR